METIETYIEKQNQSNLLLGNYENKKIYASEVDLKKTPFKISFQDKQINCVQIPQNLDIQIDRQMDRNYIDKKEKYQGISQKNQTELQRFIERKYFTESNRRSEQDDNNLILNTNENIEKNEKIDRILNQMDNHKQLNYLADIKFKQYPYLYLKLYERTKKFTIVICNYIMYSQLELVANIKNQSKDQMTEKCAFMNCSQNLQTKTKILQKYQLRKLKLLFISPEIFQHQDYHNFRCQQLIISDYHLYRAQSDFVKKILNKTCPNQTLYCSSFCFQQTPENIKYLQNQQQQVNIPIIKWISNQNKQKIIWNIIKKCQGKKVLIIVANRKQAQIIHNALSFHSISPINLCQHIPKHTIQNYKEDNILFRQYKNQNLLLKYLQKAKRFQIVISQYFDALKLLNFDVSINYRFPFLKDYTAQLELVKTNFGFVTDADYFQIRHELSTKIIDPIKLQKLLNYILQKQKLQTKPEKYKRFFSQTLDQILLKKFSVDKQDYSCEELKGIKILKCSQTYHMTKEQIQEILNILQQLKYISIMKNVNYEGNIHEYDLQKFKDQFKINNIEKNKINFLNLATEMKITTKQLLSKLRVKKIQYRITQEIIGIKLERLYNNINVIKEKVFEKMYEKVQKSFCELDTTYTTFKKYSSSNYEFYNKTKNQQIKNLNFYKNIRSYYKLQFDVQTNSSPLLKLSASQEKILKKQIIQLKNEYQNTLSQHEIVMQLKGQIIPKTTYLQATHTSKKYYRCRYEDLLEIVKEALKSKKVKLY